MWSIAFRGCCPEKTKVGHAGTLDPLASGVLLVAVGPATRLIDHAHRLPKWYLGSFLLGQHSPSDDVEVEPTRLVDPPQPSLSEIESALPSFLGEIDQRPPTYSAVKIDGREAYKRVRRGEEIEMPLRRVRIDDISLASYDYPRLELRIACGGGTYIRALGRDLAESLGTAAVMSGLVRTAVGPFSVDDAVGVSELNDETIGRSLLDPLLVVDAPRWVCDAAQERDIRHGRFVRLNQPPDEEIAAVDGAGRLVAILRPRQGQLWGPSLVFADRPTVRGS